jgi:hypothetical protein
LFREYEVGLTEDDVGRRRSAGRRRAIEDQDAIVAAVGDDQLVSGDRDAGGVEEPAR